MLFSRMYCQIYQNTREIGLFTAVITCVCTIDRQGCLFSSHTSLKYTCRIFMAPSVHIQPNLSSSCSSSRQNLFFSLHTTLLSMQSTNFYKTQIGSCYLKTSNSVLTSGPAACIPLTPPPYCSTSTTLSPQHTPSLLPNSISFLLLFCLGCGSSQRKEQSYFANVRRNSLLQYNFLFSSLLIVKRNKIERKICLHFLWLN